MNVKELKLLLEDLDDDAEVMMMTQSHYPIELMVDSAIKESKFRTLKEGDGRVFLLAGEFSGYGCRQAWSKESLYRLR